jgi:hypothetical protein
VGESTLLFPHQMTLPQQLNLRNGQWCRCMRTATVLLSLCTVRTITLPHVMLSTVIACRLLCQAVLYGIFEDAGNSLPLLPLPPL